MNIILLLNKSFVNIFSTKFKGKLHITFWLYATFFVRDKGIAKQFQRTKNVAEKNAQRAQARLRFLVARAAEGGEAHTDLLGEVKPV
jgi:hypothetical protein